MLFQDALRAFGAFLAPLSVDEFLDQVLQGGVRVVRHDGETSRQDLLGEDPAAVLAGAAHLAGKLTWHSANATGPAPSLDGLSGLADFKARIAAFHARNYSVRFPDLRPLSPGVDRLARAMEILLHQPVTASAFWSRGGMRAPVHYDDHDLIVVQLRGAKRWYVASRPSVRFNTWRGISGNPPDLGEHHVIDLAPGDLVYLPRGTFHTVDSETESLHLAIGFTPLTLREAVIAALDHLSDLDAGLRATLGGRLAFQLRGPGFEQLGPPVLDAAARLVEAIKTPGFLSGALQRRSSRAVAGLEAPPKPQAAPPIGPDTELARGELAFCHLTANAEHIDFAYPGGHLYIHRGAEAGVLFISETPRFRVRDIPGDLGPDVQAALATRFLEIGFLKLA